MMRPLLVAALLGCLAVVAPSAAGEVSAAQASTAGSYIVVFKANAVRAATEARSQRPLVAAAAEDLAQTHGANVTHVYQHALKGFAVRLSPDRAEALAADPRVAYVEPDQVVHAVATQTPRDMGARSDRPTRSTAEQHVQLQPDRAGCARLHHRHGRARDAPGVHRQDGQRRRFHR